MHVIDQLEMHSFKMGNFCLFAYTGRIDRFKRGFLYNLASLLKIIWSEKTTCWFWKTFYMIKNRSTSTNKNEGSAFDNSTEKQRKIQNFRHEMSLVVG